MCVICYKARGKKLPAESTIRSMWATNPDGAGVMWKNSKGGVDFRKGFMKLDDLLKFVDENHDLLEGTECAMHFRIGTHGGNTPGNTHPFIVDNEADPHTMSGENLSYVLMHNGILPCKPRRKDISDTAELALRAGRFDPPTAFMEEASDLLGSNKIVMFCRTGDARFYGDEWKEGKDGLLYSNLNHEWHGGGLGFSYRYGTWDIDDDGYLVAPHRSFHGKKKHGKNKLYDNPDELLTAWDVDLPEYVDLGTYEGDQLAREVIHEVVMDKGAGDLMTEYEWTLFFNTYQDVIEEQFWAQYDMMEEDAEAMAAGGE